MEQPVLTDCNYTHVLGSYCYTSQAESFTYKLLTWFNVTST